MRSLVFGPCLTFGAFVLLPMGCSAAYFGNPIAGGQLCLGAAALTLVAWLSLLVKPRPRSATDRYPVVTVEP